MVDVFISYARTERALVEPIRVKLAALGLDLFFDLESIDVGGGFPKAIDEALRASKTVLCCWTPHYFTREFCMHECRFAKDEDLLVPVVLQPIGRGDIPFDLRATNYLNLSDWSGEDAHEDWNRALQTLGQKIGRELAPELTRSGIFGLGDLKAGPAPQAPQPAAARSEMLEDLRQTWEQRFPDRDDAALVEKFLGQVPEGSGLAFEIAHHLETLKRKAAEEAARREAAERALAEQRAREAKWAASPAGTVFRDALAAGGEGPEMCVIPAGRFLMGSPEDEPGRYSDEGPQHEVTFAKPFALGRYALTFVEYDAFCAATGADLPEDAGWGRGRRPVINVPWEDAQSYCAWLSEQTGAAYRLPSEAEWEYACRAGTTTAYWWGSEIAPDQANYGRRLGKNEPVDAFASNPWGLHQMHGNVWEWCQDAWNDSYVGAPSDGSAWTSGDESQAVLRGGSWFSDPQYLRSANRDWDQRVNRSLDVGFRVARTLVD